MEGVWQGASVPVRAMDRADGAPAEGQHGVGPPEWREEHQCVHLDLLSLWSWSMGLLFNSTELSLLNQVYNDLSSLIRA
jgi:hypothetical protein